MSDSTVKQIDSHHSPNGTMGQKYLASGKAVSMRLWKDVQPGTLQDTRSRDYETVGYALKGRAELNIEGQMILLEPGDSWVVPKGSRHSFTVVEPITAVEATAPPPEIQGRDQ